MMPWQNAANATPYPAVQYIHRLVDPICRFEPALRGQEPTRAHAVSTRFFRGLGHENGKFVKTAGAISSSALHHSTYD